MSSESTLSDALSQVDLALTAGHPDRAMALTDELLVAYPDALGVWRARARAFRAAGCPRQAAEAYARVLDIVPADADAMLNWALSLSAAGQHREAGLAARQVLDYEPKNDALLHILADAEDDGAEILPTGDVGAQLREAQNKLAIGLSDQGIVQLQHLAAQRPDRMDIRVALAHALWQGGAKVAAAEVCQSILDAQPDCLNAHALLLALWRQIGARELEAPHLHALDRLDPDHRYVKRLLGDDSPLEVRDVPAAGLPGPVEPVAASEEDEVDRADWVDDLVAAASSAPKPLERGSAGPVAESLESDDIAVAAQAEAQGSPDRSVNDDAVHLDDVAAAEESPEATESILPLEWEAPEELREASVEAQFVAPEWLLGESGATMGGFVPTKPMTVVPDAKDGVPEYVEPLRWEAGTSPGGEEAAQAGLALSGKGRAAAAPRPSAAMSRPEGLPSVPVKVADRVAAAREAVQRGRWADARILYERAIVAGNRKVLQDIIADLEAILAVQPTEPGAHELLGMAHMRRGDVQSALEAYHRALSLSAG